MNKDRLSTVSFSKSIGHQKNLVSDKFGTNKSGYVFMQQVVDLWNSLPKVGVGNPKSFCTFKL